MGSSELWRIISDSLVCATRNTRGRAEFGEGYEYSTWLLVKIYLISLLEGISSGIFFEKLRIDRSFRESYGLPTRLIKPSQYKKRLHHPDFLRALFELLRQSARRALRHNRSGQARIVAMDLTRVPSDPRRDDRGAWGWDSQGLFYGYKLGLITSEEGIVLGMTLMKANHVEGKVNVRLITQAPETLQLPEGAFEVSDLVCDSGFDGERTYRTSHQRLEAPVVCPPKRLRDASHPRAGEIERIAQQRSPHRYRDESLRETPEAKAAYRKRGEIERVNGQLKDAPFRIHEIPRCRRGVKKLLPLCLGKLIIFNFAVSVAIAKGRNPRAIRALVA